MAVANDTAPAASKVDLGLRDVQYEIEQWMYAEAELLDDRRYPEWLALLADDLRYLVPLRINRPRKDLGTAPAVQSAHMEEDKAGLGVRVKRILTGLAWSEDPPGMSRHLISNVRVRRGGSDTGFRTRSNFLIYVGRLDSEEALFAGERHDVLRRVPDARGFELAERRVMLDRTVLAAINFSVFF
jgi:3-phenylpropionate/cinnamic acid dioxygenase small subunit